MRYSICLVSDFFWPNIGGVENHIFQLAQCLERRGHKVIVVTRAYGEEYSGVKYLPYGGSKDNGCGVKVYYVPRFVVAGQVSLPTIFPFFSTFREIIVKEGISIVHGHQSSSPLVHECICIGRTLGCKTMLTEHSLFGFSDVFSFDNIINKFLEITLCHVDHVICVSAKCRENLISRTSLVAPPVVSTIPNAINSWEFMPDHTKRSPGYPSVNVVLLSRLVHRKGIDLVEQVLPAICQRYPQVHFIVGGDGPRYKQLDAMRSRHRLQKRVEMLGFVKPAKVRDVLVRGHIFLNCSLTESFCISLVEAASCGLKVVSTNVGGVPEVLPADLITLSEPDTASIVEALGAVIVATLAEGEDSNGSGKSGGDQQTASKIAEREARQHERVKSLSSWMDVTLKTESIYASVLGGKGEEKQLKGGGVDGSGVGSEADDDNNIANSAAVVGLSPPFSSLSTKMSRYSKLAWPEWVFAAGLLLALELTNRWYLPS
jgi:phosphatidylinositol glycan class A protein